jgi:hypothetical protein
LFQGLTSRGIASALEMKDTLSIDSVLFHSSSSSIGFRRKIGRAFDVASITGRGLPRCCRSMVLCEFSALNPSPSQTAPRRFALRRACESGHSLAFSSKLSELFGRAHLALVSYIIKLNLKRAATVPVQREFSSRFPARQCSRCHNEHEQDAQADHAHDR